jgi:hypothetical protein
MMLTRMITLLAGVSGQQVRALPPFERLRLAHELRRLLQFADPTPLPPRVPPAIPSRPRSGVLALLADGERSP